MPDMTEPSSAYPSPLPHRARAYCKMAGVVALVGLIFAALVIFISESTVIDLRHHLTLWLIIAIVVVTNITSMLVFALALGVYKWIKRDLNPTADD